MQFASHGAKLTLLPNASSVSSFSCCPSIFEYFLIASDTRGLIFRLFLLCKDHSTPQKLWDFIDFSLHFLTFHLIIAAHEIRLKMIIHSTMMMEAEQKLLINAVFKSRQQCIVVHLFWGWISPRRVCYLWSTLSEIKVAEHNHLTDFVQIWLKVSLLVPILKPQIICPLANLLEEQKLAKYGQIWGFGWEYLCFRSRYFHHFCSNDRVQMQTFLEPCTFFILDMTSKRFLSNCLKKFSVKEKQGQ